MSTRIVHSLPHLILEKPEDGTPQILRLENRTSLSELIDCGVSPMAGQFYKELKVPQGGFVYLLQSTQADVQFAVDYLQQNPQWVARVLRNWQGRDEDRDIVSRIAEYMHQRWKMPQYRYGFLEEDLRILAWPGHGLPFRKRTNMRHLFERSLDRGILDLHPQGFGPAFHPDTRLVLGVGDFRLMVDLAECFAAWVDERGYTVDCCQAQSREQLVDVIEGLAGDNEIALLPWDYSMEKPKMGILGPTREWSRFINGKASDAPHPQAEELLSAWLGRRAAFCRDSGYERAREQEDLPSLRRQIGLQATGSLLHPDLPGQRHRLSMDTPPLEIYRPWNPFKKGD